MAMEIDFVEELIFQFANTQAALKAARDGLEFIENYYSDDNMLRQPQVVMRSKAQQAIQQIDEALK